LPWWREPKPEIQRSDRPMMQRPVPAGRKAANYNVMVPGRGLARSAPDLSPKPIFDAIYDAPLARSEPFRIGGVRPLLVAGFSGLILVALSGALIGLAGVGLVAGALGGVDLLGRHLGWSGRTLGTPNPQVLGYRP
jgi:hypothetical protein